MFEIADLQNSLLLSWNTLWIFEEVFKSYSVGIRHFLNHILTGWQDLDKLGTDGDGHPYRPQKIYLCVHMDAQSKLFYFSLAVSMWAWGNYLRRKSTLHNCSSLIFVLTNNLNQWDHVFIAAKQNSTDAASVAAFL